VREGEGGRDEEVASSKKTISFGAAHTYIAHIREYLPGGFGNRT